MVRERRVSWFIVANELQMEWIKKFNDGKKKWNLYDEKSAKTEDKSTKTEGECTAIITVEDGTKYEGKYKANSYHAEMAAWVACKEEGKQHQIIKIDISSPPCPHCTVVLEMLGLSDKVYCKKASSRNGPSINWPWIDRENLVKIITPLSKTITERVRTAYIDNIYNHFQAIMLK